MQDSENRRDGQQAAGAPSAPGEERYRRLVESAPIPISVFCRGRVVYMNPAGLRLFGATSLEQVLGKPTLSFVHPDFHKAAIERIRAIYETDDDLQWMTLKGVRLDGGVIDIEVTGTRIVYEGQPAVQAVFQDITKRRQADESVRASERRLRLIAENTTDVIFAYDMERRLIYVNPAVKALTGYSTDELPEGRFINIIHPEDRAIAEEIRQELYHGGHTTNKEFRIVTKDGRIKWCLSSWGPLYDENGKQIGIQGRERDITAHRLAEEALIETKEQIEGLINASPLPIVMVDVTGNVQMWNRSAERLFGWTEKEALGQPVPFVPASAWPEFQASLERILTGEVLKGFEVRCVKKEGDFVDLQIYTAPMRDIRGQTRGVMAILEDITERKQTRLALERRTSQRRALLEAAKRLNATLEVPEVMRLMVASALELTDATAGAAGLMIDGRMVFTEYYREGGTLPVNFTFEKSHGVAGRVMETLEPYVTNDPASDPYVAPEILETLGFHNLANVPVRSHSGELLGCIEVHNTRDGHPFGEPELELLVGLTDLASIALENALLVTARRRVEEALQTRVNFDKLITALSTSFVNLAFDEIDAVLKLALQCLGRFFGVDRSYIFEFQPPGRVLARTREWCAAGIEPMLDRTSDVSAERFPWFLERIRRFDAVNIPRVSDLPPEAAAERAEFQAQGIRSLINMPMILRGKLVGFFGFDSVRSEKLWRLEAIEMLAIVGELFVSALERRRTEEELHKSRADFQELFDEAPVGYHELDRDGAVTRVNQTELAMLGYTAEEILGRPIWDFIVEPDVSRRAFTAKITGAQPPGRHFERTFRRKDGTLLPALLEDRLLFDADGHIRAIRSTMLDNTERKRAEAALRESEERFRRMLERVPTVAVQGYGPDGRVQYWNKANEPIYGYTAEEAIGKDVVELIVPPEMREGVREAIRRGAETGKMPPASEMLLQRKDGSRVWVYSSHVAVMRQDRPPELFCIDVDLTAQKEAEYAERRFTARLTALHEVGNDLSKARSVDELCRQAVELGRSRLGFDRLEIWLVDRGSDLLVGTYGVDEAGALHDQRLYRWSTLADPQFADIVRQKIRVQLHMEEEIYDHEGRRLGDGSRAMAALWDGEQVIGILSTDNLIRHEPLTGRACELLALYAAALGHLCSRKRAEEALGHSEEQYRTTIDGLNDILHVVDRDLRFLLCNTVTRNWTRQLNLGEEIIGRPLFEVFPFLPDHVRAEYERVFETGRSEVTEEVTTLLGREIATETRKIPVFESGQVARVITVVTDITERKRSEEAERHNRAVAEAVATASLQFLETGNLAATERIIVEKAVAITGAEMGVVIDLRAGRDPHIVAVSGKVLEDIGDTPPIGTAVEQIRTQGYFAIPLSESCLFAPLREKVPVMVNNVQTDPRRTGSPPPGHPPIHSYLSVPMKVGDEVIGIIALANRPGGFGERELHETETFANTAALAMRSARSEEERAQVEEQLRQSQKMEAIGRLAGGVAHDFNNLLTAIIGYTELGLGGSQPAEPLHRYFGEIQQASERASNLTRQLLAFSRRQPLEPQVININRTLLDMDRMLRRLIGEDIELAAVAAEDLWPVRVDPSQLEQVILNLAVNARDAMPGGGRLLLETSNTHLDEEYASTHRGVVAGDFVMLAVSDTGVGMSDEVKSHLFEPFFTTKETGKGTGLGLATCYGIVKQSGGHIWVYSEPGHGTSFKIYFPRVEAGEPVAPPARDGARYMPRGSETVLVVEDEPSVRTLATRFLAELGYHVIEAENGEAALRLAPAHLESGIRLLLTDVVMPQMGGRELALRLQALFPRLRVLYVSGYTNNAIVHDGVLDAGIAFLQKPFSLSALARKMREVLDAPVGD
jgi:PAS domain S-box-containing protein